MFYTHSLTRTHSPPAPHAHFLGLLDRTTPSARDSLDRTAGEGMALPDSYSWMTWGFSLTTWASWAWVIFLARRAAMMRFFRSDETL